MKITLRFILPAIFIWLTFVCSHSVSAQFAKGADIGWLSQMEASGRKFYDDNGTEKDLLEILKLKGINSIRLRVWVNPAGGWCGKRDVAAMAKRVTDKGFRLMIDFHYSDNWADPGKQYKPAAWQQFNFSQLIQAVYDHTVDVLDTLKQLNVTPEWVQVGNETNDGMLWEEGRASKNMKDFATLINSGYDAVKFVFPNSKVLVHISNGYDNPLFRWMFDGLRTNNTKFDVIAMSLYPEPNEWRAMNSQCLSNMQDMVSRYGKEIMVSEVGMAASEAEACRDFLSDIIVKVKSVSGGLGVFYWEPQSYNWQGYGKGAWNNNGRPTVAMDAFLDNPTSIGHEQFFKAVALYPNPFQYNVTIDSKDFLSYKICDVIGNELEGGKIIGKFTTGENLPAGIYFLKLENGKKVHLEKIVKF